MNGREARPPEVWRDIRGCEGRYQVSSHGRVRRLWAVSGKHTVLRAYTKKRRRAANEKQLRVHLTLPDGRRVEWAVIKLVAEAFIGLPAGTVAVHRNGQHDDNALWNIELMTREELGRRYGRQSGRRPVVKISREGEILGCWPSARAAARENWISYQAVMDRCNGKVGKEFELDGTSYRWDDA